MKKLFKYCATDSAKYTRDNSYYNGVDRIGYEIITASDDDVERLKKEGWQESLPTKPEEKAEAPKAKPKKVAKNAKQNGKDSDINTSTESDRAGYTV